MPILEGGNSVTVRLFLALSVCLIAGASFLASLFADNGCQPQIQSNYFVDISWQPPNSFVSGEPLDPPKDLEGYEIYLITQSAASSKGHALLAKAGKNAVGCRIPVPNPGAQRIAMAATGPDGTSSLSNTIFVTATER
jgi:hypothetical protein